MKLLLDTCVFLWLADNPRRLSKKVLSTLNASEHEIFLSSVSAWEIVLKSRKVTLTRLKQPAIQFVQRELLKHQVRLAAFVDDADVVIIDAGHTRVTRPAAFVEQQMVRLRPRAAVVEADLNRVMRAALLRVRVRKQ